MPSQKDLESGASLRSLAWVFLKLGAIGFGGPAAHIAMMDDEVVRRRRWLSREDFLDLLGATNLIPGPNSTEMAIHVGHRKAGWPGLLVAGVCFILPAVFIVTAFAWAYVQYGSLPEVAGVLYGVKPVIIAIVLQALWSLGRTALKTGFLWIVAGVVTALSFLGVNELLLLFVSGVVVLAGKSLKGHHRKGGSALLSIFGVWAQGLMAPGARLPQRAVLVSGCCPSSGSSLKSGRSCMGAGMSCWHSSAPTWSHDGAG